MNDLEPIKRKIYEIRGYKVMLDSDLAELYNVETKNLKRAVRANIERFPDDFMFELTKEEYESLRCKNINIMRAFFQMQEALLIVGDALGSFRFASLFQKEDRGSEQRRAQTAVERCGECCGHANDFEGHSQAHHENHNHPSANRKSL